MGNSGRQSQQQDDGDPGFGMAGDAIEVVEPSGAIPTAHVSHVPDDGSELEAAVEHALDQGRVEFDRLLVTVELSASDIRDSGAKLRDWSARGKPNVVLSTIDDISAVLAEGLSSQLDAYEAVASTFNVALFGRTGAGKSSLITALGRLDGSRISNGMSDWTTETERIPWRGIQLIDTPGISGWGRTVSREILEETARAAVETSDLVLLCFDTQNQQVGEFRKIASWVKEYGKPCIAILNVRNPKWRQTGPSIPQVSRRTVAVAVREHARNIENQLAKIGLRDALVIAISAQTAVDARAVSPVQEIRERIERRRERYGVESLLERSCLPRVESFMEALLNHGAVDLRIAALRDGVREALKRAGARIEEIRDEANSLLQVADRTLGNMLSVLGYPDDDERRMRFVDPRVEADLITEVERLRDEPYRASIQGEIGIHVRELLTAHMSVLRKESLRSAERLVGAAFDERRIASEEEFADQVFDENAVNNAAEQVLTEASEFARAKLALDFADAEADVEFEVSRFQTHGDAGRGAKRLGHAVRGAGLLVGVGSSVYFLGGLAALNFWNPIGWVAAGVGLVGVVLSIFGSRRAKQAEKARVKARSHSLNLSRQVVHEAFDNFEETMSATILAEIRELASPSVRTVAEESIALRNAIGVLDDLNDKLSERVRSIPIAPSSAAVVEYAKHAVQQQLGLPGGASGVWLGEDWLHDTGFTAAEQATIQVDYGQLPVSNTPEIDEIFSTISEREIAQWFVDLENLASSRPDVEKLLPILQSSHENSRASVVLIGDYSTGKTSLIKRMMVEIGLPVPDAMDVGAHAATTEGRRYPFHTIDLVDTPGAQSGNIEHEDRARQTLASCALGVFMFQPNLGVGDASFVRSVLVQDDAGLPLQSQSVFCINRSDDLAGDPSDDVGAFKVQVLNKTAELSQFLARHLNVKVDPQEILVVAADPFGMVGNRQHVDRGSFADSRPWDGIDGLMGWLERGESTLSSKGREVAKLRHACFLLGQRQVELNGQIQTLRDRRRAILRMSASLKRAQDEANVLRKSIEAELLQLIENYAFDCQSDVLGAHSKHEWDAAILKLETWWAQPALATDLDKFCVRSSKRIDEWVDSSISVLGRTLDSRAVKSALPDMDALKLGDKSGDAAASAASLVAASAKLLRMIGRDQVYKIGKSLGYNFKPWEAVNMGAKIGRFGVFMAAVGPILDGLSWVQDERAEKKRDANRKALAKLVKGSVDQVSAKLVADDEGCFVYLDKAIVSVGEMADEFMDEVAQMDEVLSDSVSEQADIAQHITRARSIIGSSGEN